MRAVDLIEKKKTGGTLTKDEINFLLRGYQEGSVPDYQMSAFCMAVCFNGMQEEELFEFTTTMRDSGDTIAIENTNKFIIDKHSTGGVGDKTSIALVPLLSSLGLGVVKLTGKGLGHTGGTVDKLESLPGLSFPTKKEDLNTIFPSTGIAMTSYSSRIVPLDKKLYSLRDVTATVQSLPLIASSIMSKKLAVMSDAILLDVKVGNGAFLKTIESAKTLSRIMLSIGKRAHRRVLVVLTNMNQPLGNKIGNSLEFAEAVACLKGEGPPDFDELVYSLAAHSLRLSNTTLTDKEIKAKILQAISSGAALNALKALVSSMGAEPKYVEQPELLPSAEHTRNVKARESGYVKAIDSYAIGNAAMTLGAGRAQKEDLIDYSAGILLHKKCGQYCEIGEPLATILTNNKNSLDTAERMIGDSYRYSGDRVSLPAIILETMSSE